MPELAREGLTTDRLGRLARRVARLEGAMASIVSRAAAMLAPGQWQPGEPISFQAPAFFELPEELALRLLGRAIDTVGDEGPVELGKLEALLCGSLFSGQRTASPHPGGGDCHNCRRHCSPSNVPHRAASAP